MRVSRSSLIWLACLVGLFVLAMATRAVVLVENYRAEDGRLPFTLESALQFRMTERVYQGEGIPQHDPMIQYPEGIDVFETDTVWAEYIYAGLARLLPSSMDLALRVRVVMIGWFALAAPLLALWVYGWTRSRWAGGVAGAFYAVSLASVLRSAGLEMSRENLAVPLLIAHLAADAWVLRGTRGREVWCLGLLSALCLGLALAAWDMTQFYVLLWAVGLVYAAWRTGAPTRGPASRWVLPVIALLLVAWISPYHRAHGLWLSPAFLLLYGLALYQWVPLPFPRWRWTLLLLPWAAFWLIPHGYVDSYGHFAELLVAKLQFLNEKPVDPGLLSFNQRIMWVPALNSATWPLTFMLFPAMFFLLLVGAVLLVLARDRSAPTSPDVREHAWRVSFYLLVSISIYILFFRFHVYVAVFATAWLGWCWARVCSRRNWLAYVLVPVFVIGFVLETARVWEDPGRWWRTNVYYKELAELVDWLRDFGEQQPVLANFGVSAAIVTYADCPVLLHPKFEAREIRERVEDYGRALFTGDEERFRDWADEQGAQFYVHGVGEFASREPTLQMRYFVDALEPPAEAAARVFEFEPESVRFFEYVFGNRKYRVFRVISRADEQRADQLTIFARQALQEGDVDRAEELAWSALALFPGQVLAQEVVSRVAGLRERGFSWRPEPVLPESGMTVDP
jgi:hypothetical protein